MSAAPAGAREPQGPRAVTARELFAHEVRKDGRPLVLLRGVQKDGGGVTVEVEVYPAGSKPGIEPRRRPFSFASRDQAVRFVDDALDSLQYLNCYVAE
jgi:hypothetical protein